jgi:hypothetical protein
VKIKRKGKWYHYDVRCRTHGYVRGYVICRHVADGLKAVTHFRPFSRDRPGEILCEDCLKNHDLSLLVLVCAQCATVHNVDHVGGIFTSAETPVRRETNQT